MRQRLVLERSGAIVTLIVTLACLGCGSDRAGQEGAGAATVMCGSVPVPLASVEAGRGADELGPDGSGALRGAEVPAIDDLSSWSVVSESAAELVLIRELPQPQGFQPGDVRTREVLDVGASGDPDVGGGWTLRSAGPCALRVLAAGGLEPAFVDVDPDAAVEPGASTVALLVTEQACNSGDDAEGRIEVAELLETDASVTVVIGVRPRRGDADCPGNPQTPYRLQLAEPLGDRALLDASVVPARALLPTGAPAGPSATSGTTGS